MIAHEPGDRNGQGRQRVDEGSSTHRLALELGQVRKQDGQQQEGDQAQFQTDVDCEPERAPCHAGRVGDRSCGEASVIGMPVALTNGRGPPDG